MVFSEGYSSFRLGGAGDNPPFVQYIEQLLWLYSFRWESLTLIFRAKVSKINKNKWIKKATYASEAKIRFIANIIFLSVHERSEILS